MYYHNLILFIILTIIFQYSDAGRRIFQGQDVSIGEFRYVASWISLNNKVYSHRCTCSVLTPTWTLSAAHCMDTPPTKTRTYIFYNVSLKSKIESGINITKLSGNISKVLEAIPHPNYDFDLSSVEFIYSNYLKYDICLVRTRRIKLEQYAVISAVDYKTLIGQQVYVFGYGSTNSSSEVDVALKLNKPLQMFKGMVNRCPEEYERVSLMVICVSSPCNSMAMICGGDSGGPVIHASGILGVNSFSKNDCEYLDDLRYIHKHSLAEATSSTLTPLSPSVDWISRTLSSVQ